MIKFINKNFIQHSCTSKPSKNGGTAYMSDILPIVTGEHQKPLCRIYSTTDNFPAPMWELPMKCNNCLNEISGNINTNFNIILPSESEKNNISNVYVIVALPFNGIITSITASDNVDILNGCFTRVNSFKVEPGKTKYTKIVYFVLCIKSGDDFCIKFNTENMSPNKTKVRTKNTYVNTFSINVNDIDESASYVCENEHVSTEDIEDTENHISPKFSTLLHPRIDTKINPNDKSNKYDKKKSQNRSNNGDGFNTFGKNATVKDRTNNNHKRAKNDNPDSSGKAMKKLNKYKTRFGE